VSSLSPMRCKWFQGDEWAEDENFFVKKKYPFAGVV